MGNIQPTESRLEPDLVNGMARMARAAATHSRVPFSHYHVGASVIDERGRIHAGCIVECATFGLTSCAERNAVAAAVCSGARRLRAVMIYVSSERLLPPCGACRQMLSEFGTSMEVHMVNHEGGHEVYILDQLLPASQSRFSEMNIGNN